MYKVVSLFCGCGGSDCGMIGGFEYNNKLYKKLPFEVTYATDINEKAINTLKANFKTKQVVCEDICQTSSSEIPAHNVLVGGFPCQSFSTVNPTKDPFDDRANLYKQMVRIAKDKQPEICIAENVKGLMTLRKGQILQTIKELPNLCTKYQYVVTTCTEASQLAEPLCGRKFTNDRKAIFSSTHFNVLFRTLWCQTTNL